MSMELPADVAALSVAGVQLLALVIALTQIARESRSLPSERVPLAALALAVGLVALRAFAPPLVAETVVAGLSVGVSAAMTVHFSRRGRG